MKKCLKCNGDGFASEHNPNSYDRDGWHDCSGCPIQVQCEECHGTGKIEDVVHNQLLQNQTNKNQNEKNQKR